MGFYCTVGLHKLQQAGMFLLKISSSVDCLTIQSSEPNHVFIKNKIKPIPQFLGEVSRSELKVKDQFHP